MTADWTSTIETRAGVEAIIVSDAQGIVSVSCTACRAPLVDDDHGPFYDAATDDGTPHKCPCKGGCGGTVDYLTVFPGRLCLSCYTPIGERMARTMTAGKLTAMWGG